MGNEEVNLAQVYRANALSVETRINELRTPTRLAIESTLPAGAIGLGSYLFCRTLNIPPDQALQYSAVAAGTVEITAVWWNHITAPGAAMVEKFKNKIGRGQHLASSQSADGRAMDARKSSNAGRDINQYGLIGGVAGAVVGIPVAYGVSSNVANALGGTPEAITAGIVAGAVTEGGLVLAGKTAGIVTGVTAAINKIRATEGRSAQRAAKSKRKQ